MALSESELLKCEMFEDCILERLVPIKFRTNTLRNVHHHSYVHFLDVTVRQILQSKAGYILDRGVDGDRSWVVKQYFDDPYYIPPMFNKSTIMTPKFAKDRGLTYSVQLRVKYRQVREVSIVGATDICTSELLYENDIALANLPMMVRSSYCSLEYFPHLNMDRDECKYDEGGYFIISGRTKQIIPQETLKINKIFVLQKKIHGVSLISAEVKSSSLKQEDITVPVTLRYQKNGQITVLMPQLWNEVPFCMLLRALGMESDQEIVRHICLGDDNTQLSTLVQPSLHVVPRQLENDRNCCLLDIINTQEDARMELLQYIRQHINESEHTEKGIARRIACLDRIFQRDLLPHVDHEGATLLDKAKFLCLMANRLLQVVVKTRPIDDRDSYRNKKASLVGELLSHVFKRAFQTQVREAQRHYKKRAGMEARTLKNMICPDISHNIKPNIIDKSINQSILKGEFSMGHSHVIKGVSMELANQTRVDTLSMQVRIKTTVMDKNIKSTANRLYHNTQSFIFCPVETPEGANTGHHKHLTLTAEVTVPSLPAASFVWRELKKCGKTFGMVWIIDYVPKKHRKLTRIFLNGNWVGLIRDPLSLMSHLRRLRSRYVLVHHTAIYLDTREREVHICTLGGRYIRPLLTVKDGELAMSYSKLTELANVAETWNDVMAMSSGLIEYLDVDEILHSMIAMRPADLCRNKHLQESHKPFKCYTHCEIHPFLMFGKVGSNIPFPEYNQSPRNMYQASHGRQSVGQPNTNYQREHNMTLIYTMNNMQRPVIQTHAAKWLHTHDLPAGQNVVIALMTYTGYNQEDAIIVNRDSLDMGLFRMAFYRKYDSVQRKGYETGKLDSFGKPNPEVVQKMRNHRYYDKLNKDGLVQEETFVHDMEAIIGKTAPMAKNRAGKPFRDSSVFLRSNTSGFVDRVIKTTNHNQDQRRIVRIRSVRTPQVGDKLSSRCGQKGTIGLVLPRRDMPRTPDGIVPDLIINPHCLPSRMTVGLLLEILLAKKAAHEGKFMNGTAFTKLDMEMAYEELEEHGFDRHGLTPMVNGMTGESICAEIFVGSAFYQRLKHMSVDKIHTRSTGPRQALTRQPAEGRANDGGFRIGEMERDSIIAHGTTEFLLERLMRVSDETTVQVCRRCGWFARKDKRHSQYICEYCLKPDMVSEVNMPYVFKLLMQQLKTININPRMKISNRLLSC